MYLCYDFVLSNVLRTACAEIVIVVAAAAVSGVIGVVGTGAVVVVAVFAVGVAGVDLHVSVVGVDVGVIVVVLVLWNCCGTVVVHVIKVHKNL